MASTSASSLTANFPSSVFAQVTNMGHEQVVFCHDQKTGLKAIVGIHNTVLGPALGGTRIWPYATEAEALTDVLRLSRGMTYKSSIAGIDLGGGKAVIIGNSADKAHDEAYWRRYGQFIESIGGRYITAEDVGTTPAIIEMVAKETKHVAGKPLEMGGSGDPSPVTAKTVYLGMKASAKAVWGNDSLSGRKVGLQGAGHVGQFLIDFLMEEGAEIVISDINQANIKMVTDRHNAVTVVGPEEIYDIEMDVYAPCALGATINDNTIDRLKCAIVAGAANNQLANEVEHGRGLMERGILYAPDFLINCGGVINCDAEVKGYSREKAMEIAEQVYDKTLQIIRKAQDEQITTHAAAMRVAQERIDAVANS
jgi:leucine dehydrogenase